MAPEALSVPAVGGAVPVIEPEPTASSPTITPPAISFPKDLVVRLEVPSELVEAIKELRAEASLSRSLTLLPQAGSRANRAPNTL